MEGLKPYPEYKDSGVPWLGKIPSHWDILRTKNIFREVEDRSTTGNEVHLSMSQKFGLIESSKLEGRRLHSESYIGGRLCKKNDLVLNRLKAHLGVFASAPINGVVSPDYTIFRKTQPVEVRYFEYLFKTPVFIDEMKRSSKGIVEGFWRLYTDQFYSFHIPFPSPEEQFLILKWINNFNKLVNDYVNRKKRYIQLLNEQKLVITHQAVTRGLDPSIPTKPSCIEWLGEIPEHWKIKKISHICSNIGSGTTPSSGVQEYYINGLIPWLNTGDLNDGILGDCPLRITQKACDDYSVLRKYSSGSLVVAMYGATVGKVSLLQFETTCNQACCVLSNFHGVIPDFLLFWFIGLRTEILSLSRGGGQPNISMGIIRSFRIPIPPLNEQQRIIELINQNSLKFKKIINATEEAINTIQEYRTRLITDIVTGKLDVRSNTSALPDIEGILIDELGEEEPVEDLPDEEDE